MMPFFKRVHVLHWDGLAIVGYAGALIRGITANSHI